MICFRNKKILALAPHLDDIELAASGTIFRALRSGADAVHHVAFSLPPDVAPAVIMSEYQAGLKKIVGSFGNFTDEILMYDPRDLSTVRGEILQYLYDLNKSFNPDIVLTPSSFDNHQSHVVINEESRRIFKRCSILGYEMPWNNYGFSSDLFVILSPEDMKNKESIINCYATQKHRDFFANNIMTDLAKVRGKQVGKDYAEAFEVIRIAG